VSVIARDATPLPTPQ